MIDVTSYVTTDPFFGPAYIDMDVEADDPVPHRHIRGGFEGTDTRFRFYFPPAERYQGRMFNPLSGAHGGDDGFFGAPMGEVYGGVAMCLRLGGYMVESNQGHIGDEIDEKGGDDPTLYGHRASAEVARFSKFVAAQVYGEPPHHAYVYGGSGGGRRSPLCLENAPDAWDGALPFMGGGDVAEHGNTKKVKGAQSTSFATMFNAQRVLGDRLPGVIDAMAAGGSGDPFRGLDTHQREVLAELYRLGFPRGDEHMIGEQMGQIWLWSATADILHDQDPTYFERFWTTPGYVGHDQPGLLDRDLIDGRFTVDRVLTIDDVITLPELMQPEYTVVRDMALRRRDWGMPLDLPIAIEVKGVGRGYRLGTGVRITSGRAAGRQLYATHVPGDLFFCDGHAQASILRFRDVLPGDEVHVDNRRFLAYCYWARHHVHDDLQFDQYRVDGRAIHPQHDIPDMSSLMGVAYSGQYKGKLMWIHHTHDASLWPPQGVIYANAVLAAQGDAGAAERFRLRWLENAEHMPPAQLPELPGRSVKTWLVDYQPMIEQSLADLVAWVEEGIDPGSTTFAYDDGKVSLPATASERLGIQPVVRVSANGEVRAEARVGEPVTLAVHAEVAPGAGTIVSVEWDFDGTGTFPFTHAEVDGTATSVDLTTTHTYDRPGTWFATARVRSHREGDVGATFRRIPNVAQARVVVT